MTITKQQLASVLAFERKLQVSDGLLHACQWPEKDSRAVTSQPIPLTTKSVRGTISNRLKATISNDPAKLDAEIEKANIQTVDTASLPFDSDTLKLRFTLRVLGNLATPSACNSPAYQQALGAIINQYQQEYGFQELAQRYGQNIANGRFLWRNRTDAQQIRVDVTCGEHYFSFNSLDYSLREFAQDPAGDLARLSQIIAKGLQHGGVFLTVTAYVQLGEGQEVFPSEELVFTKGDKSKTLYQVADTAALHSQKIGNALRTIDSWHPEAHTIGPIAVEPYGAVTNRGKAYRQPTAKDDFYHLLDDWLIKDKTPTPEQQHYLMAMLIRGGVFGKSGKD